MTDAQASLVRTFKVGSFDCTLTFPATTKGVVASMVVEWSPEVPKRLTRVEMEAYRTGRAAAVADLQALTGANVGIVE